MLEHRADYAQSPYAGIRYYEAVLNEMGRGEVRRFMRLYAAPGVDHVYVVADGSLGAVPWALLEPTASVVNLTAVSTLLGASAARPRAQRARSRVAPAPALCQLRSASR